MLILGGYGPMYQIIKPRACQFTPYITLSEVKYANMVNITRVLSREATTPATAAIDGPSKAQVLRLYLHITCQDIRLVPC